MRVRLHRSSPRHLQHLGDFFAAFPIRARLYSIGLLCSPRLTLLWTYLFDHSNTVRLLALDSGVRRAHPGRRPAPACRAPACGLARAGRARRPSPPSCPARPAAAAGRS